eukprot:gnl/TRDRNA2_/TRDRNA2_94510_c0_seq1.p1 gnl/TRDRNA2_/TRDRNA2_94510_c0~~gnl/TRDRNA2_/TRDRNA2_94510_c0_seq1.p1  ORF type:complete len:598 (-),score=77.51 gnl/TRDRNA2_/TRDRNA2_94510_c0_seq1:72-1829(-)
MGAVGSGGHGRSLEPNLLTSTAAPSTSSATPTVGATRSQSRGTELEPRTSSRDLVRCSPGGPADRSDCNSPDTPGNNYVQLSPLRSTDDRGSCSVLCTRWKNGDFVLDPRQGKLWAWDVVVWLVVMWSAIVTPYECAFSDPEYDYSFWLNRIMDSVFMADMLLCLNMMYSNDVEMRWVRNPEEIVWHYLKGQFVVDLVSILPYDWFVLILKDYAGQISAFHKLKFLRMVKMMRLNRIMVLVHRYEADVGWPFAVIRLLQFAMILGFVSHVMACCWGYVGRQPWAHVDEQQSTWLTALAAAKAADSNAVTSNDAMELYVRALYWAIMTITSVGYGDIVPQNHVEYVVCTVSMGCGAVLWAYTIGTVCGVMSNLDQQNLQYEQDMDELNSMMAEQATPTSLRKDLRRYFKFKKRVASLRLKNHAHLLESMSPGLRAQFIMSQLDLLVKKVPYLGPLRNSNILLIEFHQLTDETMFAPKELIDFPQTLCHVKKGLAMNGPKLYITGDVWGEGDLLLKAADFLQNLTPVAISYVEVLHFARRSLEPLVANYPAFKQRIRHARNRYIVIRGMIHEARLRTKAKESACGGT